MKQLHDQEADLNVQEELVGGEGEKRGLLL